MVLQIYSDTNFITFKRNHSKNYDEKREKKDHFEKFLGSWCKYECKHFGHPRQKDLSIKEERKKDRTDKGLKFKPRMTTSTKIGCECVFTLKKMAIS